MKIESWSSNEENENEFMTWYNMFQGPKKWEIPQLGRIREEEYKYAQWRDPVMWFDLSMQEWVGDK